MIAFVIEILPVPWQRPGSSRGGHRYTPEATRHFEQAFRRRCQPFAPLEPFTGPLVVSLVFTFTPPPSWPKWQRALAQAGQWPHTSKPDGDNLFKGCADALSGTWWLDDAQVVRHTAEKRYGAVPSIHVEVTEMAMPGRTR